MTKKNLQVVKNKFVFDKNTVKEIEQPRRKKKPISESDVMTSNVACSAFFYRNFVLDELKKAFPLYPVLWTVSKYYPNSPFGKIYFDEPKNDFELKRSLEKKKALENEIFIIVEKGDDINTVQMKLDDELGRKLKDVVS